MFILTPRDASKNLISFTLYHALRRPAKENLGSKAEGQNFIRHP
jgi:hypothetical protein